jgi:tripartite-type tricarboxylate transporter receptor subunit TctC
MIAIAKKDPQGLTYGTAGIGSSPHIAGELLKQKTGANLVHIPYKGGGQAMTDLLGGNIPLGYTAVAGAIQHIKLGRLTPLAVSSFQRISSLPDVPTIIESGIKDFELSSWVGLLAPSKTPRPIVLRVNQALNEILVSADGKDRLNAMGIIATAGTPEKFSEQIKYDLNRFGAIVKNANIKAE